MAERWVEVLTASYKHSLAILDFLIDVAKRPRHFTSEDMVSHNKEVLTIKHSPRVMRNLRLKGLITYEVVDQKHGVYQLNSSLGELLQSRMWVEDCGYWIDEETPVITSSDYASNIEQLRLI